MTALHDSTILLDEPIDADGRLSIRLASAELRLTAVDGDRVTVRSDDPEAPGQRILVETDGGEVTLRERDVIGLAFGKLRKSLRLEVGVPAGVATTVDIASGRIDATGLRGRQHYRTASGDVVLSRTAGSLELNAVSGDVAITLAGQATLALRTVSGDVTVSGGSLDELHVSTTSGDVRVDSPLTGGSGNTIETLSGDATIVAGEGLRVEARTISGDLSSELPHTTEGRVGRRTLVVGDGRTRLSFRSVSGDLLVMRGFGNAPARGVDASAAETPHSPGASPAAGGDSDHGSTETATDASGSGAPATSAVPAAPLDDERLTVLRELERGTLDISTAMDRLAELDEREASEGDHV